MWLLYKFNVAAGSQITFRMYSGLSAMGLRKKVE